MTMKVEKAVYDDIHALVNMRIEYLLEDKSIINDSDLAAILNGLPVYYQAHLSKDLLAYVIRDGQTIVSCAFLLLIEKPMSPAFINGKTGTVLNMYTRHSYRQRGYAKMIMETMLADARELGLSVIELKSTEDGRALYRSAGFDDDNSGYHMMVKRL